MRTMNASAHSTPNEDRFRTVAHSQACSYCGRVSVDSQCRNCGAPSRPLVTVPVWEVVEFRATQLRDNPQARTLEDRTTYLVSDRFGPIVRT